MQKCDPNIPNPNSAYKYNFKKYGKDSSVIIFLDSLDKMLFRKVNKFDKQGCRWWEEDEVYNSLGKLSYREARKWSCLKPDNKNNADSNNFDALLYERERLTYDESGRVKERIWFYISTNVVKKYTYTYNQNNNQTCHITKHNCNSFWEL